MYLVTVEIAVDPDRVEEFRVMALRHAKNSSSEAGCLRFDVSESENEPGKFFIYEVYQDAESLEVHRKQPYLAEFREKSGPLMKSRKLSTWNGLN
ncbi:MAG: autoinducer-2 (AI-2) modifying protein LsrG [Rhodospirillaceae bacterium]|nr:autoinducer-2 (AI-2) modifying protein LsrG [Rhodospirillaceae bacterium]|tara:strand:- start:939 stop:1223 length:285 start_codon:yes stop_codon:yes gene_type:complete